MRRRDLLIGSVALPLIRVAGGSAQSAATPVPEDQWAHPEWFADPAWLAGHLDNPTVRVIALTSPEEFTKGHIPGGAQVDWPDLNLTDSADVTVEKWRADVENRLTKLGVTPESTVVIYDGGTFYASRVWWILDQLSHKDKRIIDGGLGAWTKSGGKTETVSTWIGYAPASPYRGTPNEATLARLAEVQQASETGSAMLVDARTPDEYGKGHIPGAVNIPFLDNTVPNSGGTWKSPADLRAMYADKGVTPDRPVIPYCSTGVRSAATYFTLTALGLPNVKLYSASYAEWSSDPKRPVER
jgi:thiosulfate/3-mercaptopyruvate sulfurtransferase